MLGNYPEENPQHTEHGESLKSRIQGKNCSYGHFAGTIQNVCKIT
jgi:hypothetical protein